MNPYTEEAVRLKKVNASYLKILGLVTLLGYLQLNIL